MIQKIPCFCENTFTVDIPQEINLDEKPEFLDQIFNGTFLNFTCPSCGKKHKPEFAITVLWPKKKARFEVFPELDRGEFYRRKKDVPEKGPLKKETIIGYPELVDRLLVLRDGLEPAAVEAIKYYLYVKAEEQYPDDEIEIWYVGMEGNISDAAAVLEFHLHGIKQDEIAVMKIPGPLYIKTLDDYKKRPKSEIFTALRVRSYLSVKNTMRPEALK
jgi:hypothetical protein